MRIERDADRQAVPNNPPQLLHKPQISGANVFDLHRTMQVQKDAVQIRGCPHSIQNLIGKKPEIVLF